MTEVNVTPPVISGSPRVGQVLSTDDGTWTFSGSYLTYAYEWERCDAGGANCVAIPGATTNQYQVDNVDIGFTFRSEVTATEHTTVPPSPSAYWDEDWTSGVVPADWLTARENFGSGDLGKITYAFVADPLAVNGTVLRLRDQYDSTKTPAGTTYTAPSRQLVSLFRGAGQAHSGYQTINEETWYRTKFMAPAGNVFADGEANFVVEWHTDNATQNLGGNSPAVLIGYGYPLTADGTTTPLGIVCRWNSGNPSSPTATYWPSSDSSGSFAALDPIPWTPGHWYDMKFRVIWSTNPSIGRVEWTVDGVSYLARTMATLYTTSGNFNNQSYHNFGLYNYRYAVTGDSSIYFDRCVAGPSAASIA